VPIIFPDDRETTTSCVPVAGAIRYHHDKFNPDTYPELFIAVNATPL
jgi:hypothetical protein